MTAEDKAIQNTEKNTVVENQTDYVALLIEGLNNRPEEMSLREAIETLGYKSNRQFEEEEVKAVIENFGEDIGQICLESNNAVEFRNTYYNALGVILDALIRTSTFTGTPVRTLAKTNLMRDVMGMYRYYMRSLNDRTRSSVQENQENSPDSE